MKRMNIEELLTWAFVHELPKGGGVDGLNNMNSAWRMLEASSWGKILGFAELGALVDCGAGDAENFLIEQGEPHDDAVAIGRAVAGLAACTVMIPKGWNPLGDWPEGDGIFEQLKVDAVNRAADRFLHRGAVRHGREMVSLVIGTAILGREPSWQADAPRVRMVERSGKPAWFVSRVLHHEDGRDYTVEVDGFNARTQRPMRGAYRKFEFSDDPVFDVLARLDHQIWVAALRHLERSVAGELCDHVVVASDRSATPWLERDMAGVSVISAAMKKTAA